jgi:hypothetical protein
MTSDDFCCGYFVTLRSGGCLRLQEIMAIACFSVFSRKFENDKRNDQFWTLTYCSSAVFYLAPSRKKRAAEPKKNFVD